MMDNISTESFEEFLNTKFIPEFEFSCLAQSVERIVKLVTEILNLNKKDKITGGYVWTTLILRCRHSIANKNSKQWENFLRNFKNNHVSNDWLVELGVDGSQSATTSTRWVLGSFNLFETSYELYKI